MNLPVPLYALVLEEEKRLTKSQSSFFWQVILKTVNGTVKAFMWNAPKDAETNLKFPHTGDVIEVTGFDDQTESRGNIVINTFRRTTKADLPENAQSILEFEKASKEDLQWALELIGDSSFWEDETHHKFVMDCLENLDKDKLMTCPAATHVHHQYQGGLLVHTAEVLELALANVSTCVRRYPFINKDVVYAGAILHDIGKVETYYINDMGVATSLTTEKTIGHLFYGMHLVQETAKQFDDKDFVNEVMHCIASHHGTIEWGSIRVVQSLEAGILSRVDYISSRNGMVDQKLKESQRTGQPLQDEFKIYGDPYFASIGMKRFMKQ